MRVAVIGIGQQGRHHLRFLREMEGIEVRLLVDLDLQKILTAAQDIQAPVSTTYQDHLHEFDAAIIAVPTVDHYSIARDLIEAGKHVLIEKPVTATVEDAEKLSDLAQKKGIVAQVGFPERFNMASIRSLPSITHPLFVEVHRLGMFSPRSLDIDVVLDVMIHDLDLLTLFLKEEPSGIEAVGIPILSQQVDIANARLKFPGNCVVNLTASRVSVKRMRKMRIFQPYYYLSLDFIDQSVSMLSLQPNACAGGFPEIKHKEYKPDIPQHPLLKELQAFCDGVNGKQNAGVSIRESIPSLKIALSIKQLLEHRDL